MFNFTVIIESIPMPSEVQRGSNSIESARCESWSEAIGLIPPMKTCRDYNHLPKISTVKERESSGKLNSKEKNPRQLIMVKA